MGENLAQAGGLGLQMDRQSHLQALERLAFLELLVQTLQQGHVMPYPIDFEFPAFPKFRVPDHTTRHTMFFKKLTNIVKYILKLSQC